jgi:hypothetical protein
MRATTFLMLAASSVLLGACPQPAPTPQGSADLVPTISGSIPMLAPDGKTIYYVQIVCTTVVRYSAPETGVKTPTLSVPSLGVTVGAGSVDIQKTTLQQASTILQALDLAQFNACRDAILRPGNTDSTLLYTTMSTVLVAYAMDLAQAQVKGDSQVEAVNQKGKSALDQAKTAGATAAATPKAAETPATAELSTAGTTTGGASSATAVAPTPANPDTVAALGKALATVGVDALKVVASPPPSTPTAASANLTTK